MSTHAQVWKRDITGRWKVSVGVASYGALGSRPPGRFPTIDFFQFVLKMHKVESDFVFPDILQSTIAVAVVYWWLYEYISCYF